MSAATEAGMDGSASRVIKLMRRFEATGDCRPRSFAAIRSAGRPRLKTRCVRGAAKAECHPMFGTLAPVPDQILREFVETGTLLIKGRRRYGKIAQIASLPRDSILSHPKVYYPGQATGLKQILLGIAYGLR
jgi:hypothetical protein